MKASLFFLPKLWKSIGAARGNFWGLLSASKSWLAFFHFNIGFLILTISRKPANWGDQCNKFEVKISRPKLKSTQKHTTLIHFWTNRIVFIVLYFLKGLTQQCLCHCLSRECLHYKRFNMFLLRRKSWSCPCLGLEMNKQSWNETGTCDSWDICYRLLKGAKWWVILWETSQFSWGGQALWRCECEHVLWEQEGKRSRLLFHNWLHGVLCLCLFLCFVLGGNGWTILYKVQCTVALGFTVIKPSQILNNQRVDGGTDFFILFLTVRWFHVTFSIIKYITSIICLFILSSLKTWLERHCMNKNYCCY